MRSFVGSCMSSCFEWYLLIVVINYLFGVIHAAVTYFYGVPVEDFLELVIFREVLVC